jgi:hypothetical protein
MGLRLLWDILKLFGDGRMVAQTLVCVGLSGPSRWMKTGAKSEHFR